jgi:hypothetical protein
LRDGLFNRLFDLHVLALTFMPCASAQEHKEYPPFAEAVFICFHVEHPALKNVPRLRTVDNDDQLLHFTLDEPF